MIDIFRRGGRTVGFLWLLLLGRRCELVSFAFLLQLDQNDGFLRAVFLGGITLKTK